MGTALYLKSVAYSSLAIAVVSLSDFTQLADSSLSLYSSLISFLFTQMPETVFPDRMDLFNCLYYALLSLSFLCRLSRFAVMFVVLRCDLNLRTIT